MGFHAGSMTHSPQLKAIVEREEEGNNRLFEVCDLTSTRGYDNDGSYWEPAIGICNRCKRDVVLDHSLTNTCECGAEYNLSGQELAPRSQWGWDTGETIDEIMEGNVGINEPVDHLFDRD